MELLNSSTINNLLNRQKMKNIKDIVIGIFAIIGFASVVTGFTKEENEETEIPKYVIVPSSHTSEHGAFILHTPSGTVEFKRGR